MKPELRFKNFDNNWTEFKLQDIYNFHYGIGSRNPNNGGNYPIYGANGIIGGYDKYNAENSVIIGHMGTYAGNVSFEKNKHFVTYNGIIATPKNINVISPHFGYYALFKKNLPQMCIGSGMPFLSYEKLNPIKLYIPNMDEQNKISEFLELFDEKINIQKQKIEKLKIYKNGLIKTLQKNNYEWRSFKIKDLFHIARGNVIAQNTLKPFPDDVYKYPVYSSQTSNYGVLGYDNKYDFDGSFLTWTTDGINAGKVFYRDGKFRCTNVCGLLYTKKNENLSNLLTADLLNFETPKYVSYVGNPKLMNHTMAEIVIKLPSPTIQKKKTHMLNIYNQKIDIETQKLKKLICYRKGLLQKLFI